MDEGEGACALRDSGDAVELDALCCELRGDLRANLVMTEEAEQKAGGSEAGAGDQGGADQAPSLDSVFLDGGRPSPGGLGCHEDVV
jgi:hypothetical protein